LIDKSVCFQTNDWKLVTLTIVGWERVFALCFVNRSAHPAL